jgi:hypothetical protein
MSAWHIENEDCRSTRISRLMRSNASAFSFASADTSTNAVERNPVSSTEQTLLLAESGSCAGLAQAFADGTRRECRGPS